MIKKAAFLMSLIFLGASCVNASEEVKEEEQKEQPKQQYTIFIDKGNVICNLGTQQIKDINKKITIDYFKTLGVNDSKDNYEFAQCVVGYFNDIYSSKLDEKITFDAWKINLNLSKSHEENADFIYKAIIKNTEKKN